MQRATHIALPAGLFSALLSPRRNPAGQITRAGKPTQFFIVMGPCRQYAPVSRMARDAARK